jgi:hypothetical protein
LRPEVHVVAQNKTEATFGLLENGLDFLASALDRLRGEPTPRDMKYGVLHLLAGVGLILKEPLRRYDPKLVFEDPSQFSQAAYDAGAFKSVGIDECMKRLKIGVKVPRAAIRALRGERNRLEHSGATISVEELSAVTASVLSFVVDFVRYQIGQITKSEVALVEQRPSFRDDASGSSSRVAAL